jgi:hypothetical protein
MVGSSLRLTYVGLTEQDMLDILLHYQDMQGIYFSFALPANTLSGLTAADYTLTGFSWRYSASPTVLDLPCNRYTVEVELESVESKAALISVGLRSRVGLSLLGGSAFAANGIDAEVGFTLNASGAGVTGITESISLAFADNGAAGGNGSAGLTETISLAFAPGSAAAANGIDKQINLALNGGIAEIGTSDPDFASVSLLLPFDGADGSTTFTDLSSNILTVTRFGDAQISTAQSKFGGSSGLFDAGNTGNGDYLLVPADGTAIGTGDFTIEGWVRTIVNNNFRAIVSLVPGSDNDTLYVFNGTVGWYSASSLRAQSGAIFNGTWHHVAVTRQNGTLRTFVDGVKSPNDFTSTSSIGDNTIRIGTRGSATGEWFSGYIDDLRITKGVARYTANFTPPTEAFPTS